MPKFILFVSIFFITINLYGQETKIVKNQSSITTGLVEEYAVLKADKNIKNGNYYLKSTYGGKVLTSGYYKNNLKDSVWTDYNPKSAVIGKGKFEKDHRVGIWEYFNFKGELENKFDFTTNQIVYHLPDEIALNKRYQVILSNKDTIITKLDREPLYMGGTSEYIIPMIVGIRTPLQALQRRISGRVVIAFTIDEQGHSKDYRVAESLGYGCDEEVLNILTKNSDNWFPAILNGKPVASIFRVPCNFNAN